MLPGVLGGSTTITARPHHRRQPDTTSSTHHAYSQPESTGQRPGCATDRLRTTLLGRSHSRPAAGRRSGAARTHPRLGARCRRARAAPSKGEGSVIGDFARAFER